MNIENLKKMVNYLKTISEYDFTINMFRERDNRKKAECDSIGCAIGHCTILDSHNVDENYRDVNGHILFKEWSYYFTEIKKEYVWEFLFSSYWDGIDNTLNGAIKRLEYVIENGEPVIVCFHTEDYIKAKELYR